jgi:peptidoglycan hydrolase-like protein with peptidoglycan-binding domain
MFRRGAVVLVLGVFVFSLAGCATARKQKELENEGLRNQVSALEAQLQSKEDELSQLKAALAESEIYKRSAIGELKSRPNIKQIQIALLKAGYDPGVIDGRMGAKTRQAIKDFQKANNLQPDGRVGQQTWNLLLKYLNQPLK